MTYATTNIGYDTTTQRKETKTTAPSAMEICRTDAEDKRYERNPQGQTAIRTCGNVANSFLKNSFLPKLQEPPTLEVYTDKAEVERDFYKSLSNLADHFGLTPKPVQSLSYPYNISTVLADLMEQLKDKDKDPICLVHHKGSTFFAQEEQYDTGMTLYYIAVAPLYNMLSIPEHKQTALLLLSVYSYLYKIVDIPYYRHPNCYLNDMYSMIEDWIRNDEEEAVQDHLDELKRVKHIGDEILKELQKPKNLKAFESRLSKFRQADDFDGKCHQLAEEVFKLYRDYPNRPIYHKCNPEKYMESTESNEVVCLDKYVSFFASGKDTLSDFLIETINTDLQECTLIDEPILYRPIDGRKMMDDNFDFEQRLFALITELTILLNEFDER